MNRRVFRPFERQAYTQAAVAVAANRFEIRIHRLVLRDGARCGCRPNLQSYEDWCPGSGANAFGQGGRAEDYVTTLLAGSVGHLILQEKSLGYRNRSTGQQHLERRRRAEARRGEGWLNDQANYLAFLWLDKSDDGNLDATIARLWTSADELLRRPENLRQLERLAVRLLVRREMFESEITECLKSEL